jgi:hypothetical protein
VRAPTFCQRSDSIEAEGQRVEAAPVDADSCGEVGSAGAHRLEWVAGRGDRGLDLTAAGPLRQQVDEGLEKAVNEGQGQ